MLVARRHFRVCRGARVVVAVRACLVNTRSLLLTVFVLSTGLDCSTLCMYEMFVYGVESIEFNSV